MNLDERYMQYMANGMIEASDAELAAAEKPAGFEVSPMFGAAAERPKTGAVEAAGTVASGIAASVPAGLAGIYELIKTQDPKRAQERISQIQQALTAIPKTEEGMKTLESVGKFMEAIGVTGEMAGDLGFNAARFFGAGEKSSAAAGVFSGTLLDPINLVTLGTLGAGIKGVRETAGKAIKGIKSVVTKDEAAPTIQPTKPDAVGEYMYEKSAAMREPSYTSGYEAIQPAKRLEKSLVRLESGKIDDKQFQDEIKILQQEWQSRVDENLSKRMGTEKARGADEVRRRLLEAKTRGFIEPDNAEFGLWFLNKNPNAANNLGISVRTSAEDGVAGKYNPLSKVATLFKGSSSNTSSVHEILHHTERMMPQNIQKGILDQWAKDMSKAYKSASLEEKQFLGRLQDAAEGDQMAFRYIKEQINSGKYNYDKYYQLTNPSEYWAVNATRIMTDRYLAKQSWVKQAKQWVSEMSSQAAGTFGLSSDAPVIKGLKNVTTGTGEFQTKKMIGTPTTAREAAIRRKQFEDALKTAFDRAKLIGAATAVGVASTVTPRNVGQQ